MLFYREVDRAMSRIDKHIQALMSLEENLSDDYNRMFMALLDRAEDFGEEGFRGLEELGRLRKLKHLNLTTIASLQYLRMCVWVMLDGLELEVPLDSRRAIEKLRGVNEALRGSSETQVKRLDRFVMMMSRKLTDSPPDLSRNIVLALKSVDEDVGKIFGEAILASERDN